MPTLDINKYDLENLLGKRIDTDLETFFLSVKGEVDGYENGEIKLDIKETNRPDLWSVEGIARELKADLGIEKGTPDYKFGNSDYTVTIDKNLENIRPVGVYAVAKNVHITNDFLKSLIQMQEKITGSFGRNRKEIAIGIFDLDKCNGKKFKYYAEKKDFEFTPLGFDKKMSMEKILKEHPKGKEFAHLLSGNDKYPLLVDETNEVLSMPPIINSEHSGKVTMETKNLFLDVTGYDLDTVNTALLILCMALADRGAKVEKVKLKYHNKEIFSPMIETKEITFEKQKVFDYFGEKLEDKKIIELLERKRYDCEITKDKIKAKYLNYRTDIMHPVDVIEDMLISYGYDNIPTEELTIQTIGSISKNTDWLNLVREAGLGLNLQEIVTFTLTSKVKQFNMLGIKGNPVEIANPMSEKIEIFREQIFPEILELLTKNQHLAYPQNLYEVGKTLHIKNNKVIEQNKLSVVLCHNGTNYTEIKQYLESALRNIGAEKIKFKAMDFTFLIEGRSAKVEFEIKGKKKEGIVGELNPQTLENFNLAMPTTVFEIVI
jgi:phenylalanyl-tRNA synthetase beta chain